MGWARVKGGLRVLSVSWAAIEHISGFETTSSGLTAGDYSSCQSDLSTSVWLARPLDS